MSIPRLTTPQQNLDDLMEDQQPGVAQAILTFEAVERVYFAAVAASPQAVQATTDATTTGPR